MPHPPDPSDMPARLEALQQKIQHLEQVIDQLNRDHATLKSTDQTLDQQIQTLQGAVAPLYEEKLDSYGEGKPLFTHYRAFIVDSFEASVIDKIFSSDSFVKRIFASVGKYLLNVRGIFTILGVGFLGVVGFNALVTNMAQSVFKDRIESEYPQLVDRLERDRDTLMLLILDLSSQDRPHMDIVRSNNLGIDRLREAYLDSNPNYQDVLADFLGSSDDSGIFSSRFNQNREYKAIQRFYALNYIVQVPPIEGFQPIFYDILRDDAQGAPGIGSSRLAQIHAYNQILAVQALRQYGNQLDNLVTDILLNGNYRSQFSKDFFRGFFNDLIYAQASVEDVQLLRPLLGDPAALQADTDLASTMTMLYMVYPELCPGPTQCEDGYGWLGIAKQRYGSKQGSEENSAADDALASDSSQEETFPGLCVDQISAADYAALLTYRQNRILPSDPAELQRLGHTFTCIVQLYLADPENFAFYQGQALFAAESGLGAPALRRLSAVQQDWLEVQWAILEQDPAALAYRLYSDSYYSRIPATLSLYHGLPAANEVSSQSYSDGETGIYDQLKVRSEEAYGTWAFQRLITLIENSRFTGAAFADWKREEGITAADVAADTWIIESFFSAISSEESWDATSQQYGYFSIKRESIAALQSGESFNYYLEIMGSGYYDPSLWLQEIYPYFEGLWGQVEALYQEQTGESLSPDGAGAVTGTNTEQDALWRWIEANEERLRFEGERWVLAN